MSKNRTVAATLSTSNQDVYSSPPQWQSSVDSILICNNSETNVTVNLDWYEATEDSYHTLFHSLPVPANSMVQVTDVLWLHKGDKIRGLASVADVVSVNIKVSEVIN